MRKGIVKIGIAGLLGAALFAAGMRARADERDARRVAADKSGQFSTSPGLNLRVIADQGDIHIFTANAAAVSYHVHLETSAGDRDAQRILSAYSLMARSEPDGVELISQSPRLGWGHHLWVTLDVTVPREYNLHLSTSGGNIQIADIHGRVSARTGGGNISAGQISGLTSLITDGGHILVKNVNGDLTARTGGGDITVGDVSGSAILHTSGGHIRVASIDGSGRLQTGGGNISLEHAGAGLVANTGGGEIEVGEASGLIRARTGGGGIRVVKSLGPTELDTGAGSVYLMQVQSAVRASTGAGGITAWFGPNAKLTSACRLAAAEGDINVYLPRKLAVTVDAQVQLGGGHRVIVDPAFPLKVTYGEPDEGSGAVRAEGALNGGGAALILRTVSGNIRLMLNDAQHERQEMDLLRMQMEKMRRQLEMNLMKLQVAPRTPLPPAPPRPPDHPED